MLALPVLRCGSTCNARIQRGSKYFISPKANAEGLAQHWCNKCYNALPKEFVGLLGDHVKKADLIEKTNDEVFLEQWLRCSRCKQDMHQVCALYVGRASWSAAQESEPDPAKDASFVCFMCLSEGKKASVKKKKEEKQLDYSAAMLPSCSLSDHIFARITTHVEGSRHRPSSFPNFVHIDSALLCGEFKRTEALATVREVVCSNTEDSYASEDSDSEVVLKKEETRKRATTITVGLFGQL